MTDRDALMAALYGGSAVSKSEKKPGLSNTDKGLIAANGASAVLGSLSLPALTQNLRSKMPSTKPRTPNPRIASAARRIKMTPVGRGAASARAALKSKKFALPVAGLALGGQVFNVAADAASTKSIADKGKINKADLPVGQKIKLKALDTAETAIRQNAPRAKKAAKAAADTWKAEASVSKAYEDKREVYGWASITEMNGEPVVDRQGDFVTIEEIEKAAHKYVSESRKGGNMHKREGEGPVHVADLIESVVITPEKKEALGLPADSPTGWWIGMKVHDDETWRQIKDGERPMFSIHGSGRRIDREDMVAKSLATAAVKVGNKAKYLSRAIPGESRKVANGLKRGVTAGDAANATRVRNLQGPRYSAGYNTGVRLRPIAESASRMKADAKVRAGAAQARIKAGAASAGGSIKMAGAKTKDYVTGPHLPIGTTDAKAKIANKQAQVRRRVTMTSVAGGAATAGGGVAYTTHSGTKRKRLESTTSTNRYGY